MLVSMLQRMRENTSSGLGLEKLVMMMVRKESMVTHVQLW